MRNVVNRRLHEVNLKLNIDLPNLASEPAPSMFTHPPIIYV